jgi:signal transduction histidine kinase
LLFRLYAYQALLFLCVLAASFGAMQILVVKPPFQAEHSAAVAFTANVLLSSVDDSSRLREDLIALRATPWVRATIFRADGRVVGSTEADASPPLSSEEIVRLSEERTLRLSPHSVAVARVEGGHASAYAVMAWADPLSPLGPLLPFGILLLAVGLGSIPLARSIARPLERLATVTQAFGLGDLRSRAPSDRGDEVGDLARTFNIMADRVEALRRAEKELLANVSHELRTPLARIRVVLELATEDGGDVVRRYLTDIATDLTEVEQILGDIIVTARLDLAKERSDDPFPPLRRTQIDLGAMLEDLGRRVEERHPGRVVHVTMDADADFSVYGDRVMLKHSVANIIDNAHKYSPLERIIEVHVGPTRASLAEVTVTDAGIGIDREDLARVFDPFFRTDRSRTRATGGVGLGLTLAKRIVEAHGGSIAVESDPGRGTSVTLKIPTMSTAVEPVAATPL